MQPLAPPDLDLKYKIVVVFTLNGDRAAMESQLAAIRLQFAILLGINQEDIAISGVDGTGLRRLLAGTQVRALSAPDRKGCLICFIAISGIDGTGLRRLPVGKVAQCTISAAKFD